MLRRVSAARAGSGGGAPPGVRGIDAALSMEHRDRIARAAGRQAEVACAELRYDAGLLDALSFASEDGPKEQGGRGETLAALESNGLRRHEMHRLTDGVLLVQRDLLEIWQTADAVPAHRMRPPISNESLALWYVARQRLQTAFERASKSISAAQARLPLDRIHSWRVPVPLSPPQPPESCDSAGAAAQSTPAASGVGMSMSCTICLGVIDLAAGEVALRLPCGHEFHESCAMEWLHANTTCPVCRSELAQPAQRAGEGQGQGVEGHGGEQGEGGGEGEGDGEGGEEVCIGVPDEDEGEEGEWETCSDEEDDERDRVCAK